jgi:hypothetical protein
LVPYFQALAAVMNHDARHDRATRKKATHRPPWRIKPMFSPLYHRSNGERDTPIKKGRPVRSAPVEAGYRTDRIAFEVIRNIQL